MNANPSESPRRTRKTAASGATAKKTAKKATPAKRQPARKTSVSSNGKGSGEFRSGPAVGTTLVDGATFRAKALHYAEVDGLAMFEGDIVLGTVEELTRESDAGPVLMSVGIPAIEQGQQRRWPDATVPFEIDPGLPDPQRVTDAIAHWQSHTRIRFVERTPANAAQFPDFVRFVPGDGCSSNIGRRGGMQQVTLGPNCSTGNAIHEIGHTVGLWHEQSREDRDQHVTIVFANIQPDKQHNFLQHIADGDDLGPYDFASIMHYPATAFAIDPNQPTIVPREPLPPGTTMGQRSGLSQGDVDGVHMMYPAPAAPTIKEVSKDPVFDAPTIKEVTKDGASDPHKIPGQDLMSPPALSSPFVLATPHQSPVMTGQLNGVGEQLRQLGEMVFSLQQGLAAVQGGYNLLLAQVGTQPGVAGRPL
ncbi:Dot/Icm T4SS effector Zinc-dependent metalloprotease LegP [Streptomyces sp. TLI_105]|uniref:Dot/Icm T4SS effector Zinc-dependent metalloprotease LegP n=1 Tax=Streptomyces sp. TLI_105 TaxID=1881019 RepID=UPI0008967B3A|nr:Dot/Icm T4SS effector Zinc-dependent metalloprotease LegP [Streptomyces sp. TLI_105]SED98308.1 Astacin (Peptidase family M12A) [Streptomyces sp. TLI_105]